MNLASEIGLKVKMERGDLYIMLVLLSPVIVLGVGLIYNYLTTKWIEQQYEERQDDE